MNRSRLAVVSWSPTAVFLFCCSEECAAQNDKMSIEGAVETWSSSPSWQFLLYLSGPIDIDAAARLETYIVANHVPRESWAILDSPGGNLYGGMELGRVIRKYDLRTNIGKAKSEPPEVRREPR